MSEVEEFDRLFMVLMRTEKERDSLRDQLNWSIKNEAQYKDALEKAFKERDRYKAALQEIVILGQGIVLPQSTDCSEADYFMKSLELARMCICS